MKNEWSTPHLRTHLTNNGKFKPCARSMSTCSGSTILVPAECLPQKSLIPLEILPAEFIQAYNFRVNKDENGKQKVFLYPCCLKYYLRLIAMSTNLEYRDRERQRKRGNRRQDIEFQREKEQQTGRARGKRQRRHSFVARAT